jgi:hypothetical protein
MATPVTRIESFIKECVPPEKQADFRILLKEFRHSVFQEASALICEQAASPKLGTEVRLFSSDIKIALLGSLSRKEIFPCKEPESSQRSEVEI